MRTELRGTPEDVSAAGGCTSSSTSIARACTKDVFSGEIVDVVADDSDVFFTTPTAVMRASSCGDTLTTLATCAQPDAIAIDDGSVYFTTVALEEGTLVKMPRAGGALVTLASFQDRALGLAVRNGTVYWTTSNSETHDGFLRTIPVEGGDTTTIFSGPVDAGLAVDANFVYWGSARAILKAELGTSGWGTLTDNQLLAGIAVDATHVYWTDGCGRLARVPIAGGKTELVVGGTSSGISAMGHTVIADDTSVYWTAPKATETDVLRLRDDTTAIVASEETQSSGLALSGAYLFWGNHLGLHAFPR